MPWFAVPTLEHAPDGALVIRKPGPTQAEFRAMLWNVFVLPWVLPIMTTPTLIAPKGDRVAWFIGLLICLSFAVGCFVLFQFQTRPREVRIDDEGVECCGGFWDAHQIAWQEVRRVHWFGNSIGLIGSRSDDTFTFCSDDHNSADWPVIRDRLATSLRGRFDLPDVPYSTESSWTRIILLSLPPAVLIGGTIPLMPHLSPRQVAMSSPAVAGATLAYIALLVVLFRRTNKDTPSNNHRPRPAANGENPTGPEQV